MTPAAFAPGAKTVRSAAFVVSVALRKTMAALLLCVSVVSGFAADIVEIKTPILVSHFSQQIKEPPYVSYTLYKGGGDCSRSGNEFQE